MIINCLYWAPGDPKIMTKSDLNKLIKCENRVSDKPGVPYLPQKLLVISDISADIDGSLEFVESCTPVDKKGSKLGRFSVISK